MRLSALIGMGMRWGKEGGFDPDLGPKMVLISEHIFADEVAEAREVLDDVLAGRFPDELHGYLRMTSAATYLMLERYDEAGVDLEAAQMADPELPYLKMLRATLYLGTERYEEAIVEAEAFLALLGGDADAYHVIGLCLEELDRTDEALEAYRNGLVDDPSSFDNLAALGLALPAEEKDEIAAHFARLIGPEQHFETIAAHFLDGEDAAAMEVVVEAYRRIAPEDPNVGYYGAQAAMLREDWDGAAEELAAVIPRVGEEDGLEYYCWAYLDCLFELDRPLDGYGDPVAVDFAFEYIASGLADAEETELLRELIARHERSLPDDDALPLYRAELLFAEGDNDGAASLLLAERERILRDNDGERLGRLENLLVRSLVRADRLAEAQREAAASTARDGDPYYEVIVGAVAGDVAACRGALEECLRQGYEPATFLDDVDAGSALAGDAFANLRAELLPDEPESAPPDDDR